MSENHLAKSLSASLQHAWSQCMQEGWAPSHDQFLKLATAALAAPAFSDVLPPQYIDRHNMRESIVSALDVRLPNGDTLRNADHTHPTGIQEIRARLLNALE